MRRERPREDFRAKRVRGRKRIPGRVVGIEIAQNKEVRVGREKRGRE